MKEQIEQLEAQLKELKHVYEKEQKTNMIFDFEKLKTGWEEWVKIAEAIQPARPERKSFQERINEVRADKQIDYKTLLIKYAAYVNKKESGAYLDEHLFGVPQITKEELQFIESLIK